MKPVDGLPHPPHWLTITVRNGVEIRRGVSWSKEQEHSTHRPGTVPVIRIGNVQESLETLDLLYLDSVPQETLDQKRVARGWSLLVGSNGNPRRVGNPVYISEDTGYLFASFLIAVRPRDTSTLDPEFLYRWLTTERVQAYLSASSEGTTGLYNLSHSFFRAMTISFPRNLTTQRAVAELLAKADLAIERTLDTKDRAQELKFALVQRLLEEGTRHERTRKTVIGNLPVSWEPVQLRSVVREFQYGMSIAMERRGELPILRMGNIQAGDVLLADLKYVTLPDAETAPYLLRRGDVLFNRTNSQELVGKVGVYRSDEPSVFASYLIRLKLKEDLVDPYFLGHMLNAYPTQCRIKRYATPGVQQVNVNAKNLGRVLIPLPSGPSGLAEQQEVAEILEAADERIRRIEVEVQALRALRRSLTEDLLTGLKAVGTEVASGSVTQ